MTIKEIEPYPTIPTIPGAGLGRTDFTEMEQKAEDIVRQMEAERELQERISNLTLDISQAFMLAVKSQESMGSFKKRQLFWRKERTTRWQFTEENTVMVMPNLGREFSTDLIYNFKVNYRKKKDQWHQFMLNRAQVEIINKRADKQYILLLEFSGNSIVGVSLSWKTGRGDDYYIVDSVWEVVDKIVKEIIPNKFAFLMRRGNIGFYLGKLLLSVQNRGAYHKEAFAFDYVSSRQAFLKRTVKENKFAPPEDSISVNEFVEALRSILNLIPVSR